ncbi:MAG TPA: hypothetical protein VHB50_04535, partial [Bryobacteraceae bacterium]|nr:hypothetical protein [Bryobacteraceae bacterium]
LAVLYGGITLFLLRCPKLPAIVDWHGFYVLSRLSYGIYLNQFYTIEFIPYLKSLIPNPYAAFSVGWILALFGCLLFSFLTFAFIELPFLHMRERWLGAGTPKVVQEKVLA